MIKNLMPPYRPGAGEKEQSASAQRTQQRLQKQASILDNQVSL